jgi:hypothetical protein
MKKYIYLVYSPKLSGEELTKHSFVYDNEIDADAKLVELVSVQGLPYFLIRKIQIKGVL